jgi:50S ribosomal protein L16 3-hydroxylase
MTGALQFPPGLDAQRFLQDYWQQQPLLMRQALPGVSNPLAPEELAGLACEAEVESRLIVEQGRTPWELRHGPFTEDAFTSLPASHWTLLVQDVDKHLPAAAELLEHFSFMPRWRLDDLMISYAADQGSVGPHLDAYDVFLVQTLGTRRWQISSHPYSDADLVPGLDLKVLNQFAAEHSWVLEPGDVLYLPPGVAHWGIAEGPCMTCSVGFRSPSQRELAAGWLQTVLDQSSEQRRYRDPRGLAAGLGGRIPTTAVAAVRALLEELCQWDDADLTRWFGQFITEPKPQLEPLPPDPELTLDALAAGLTAGQRLVPHPYARLAYVADDAAQVQLYADGQAYTLSSTPPWVVRLCDREPLSGDDLPADHQPLLAELYNQGSLLWEHEADELLD